MSFLSGLKRVTAAVTTGGLSLLAPTKTQEQIGNVSLGAQAIGALGAGAGVLAAGGTLASAGSAAGGSAFNIGTAGSQIFAGLAGKGLAALGIGGAPSAPPPDASNPPPNSFLDTLGSYAPFAKYKSQPFLPGSASGSGSLQKVALGAGGLNFTGGGPGNGFGDVGTGLPIPGGMMPVGLPGAGIAGAVASGAARMVGNLVVSAKNAVRGIMTAGGFVSSAKVAELAERFGLDFAAAGLGVSLGEVAMSVVSHHSHKRKRRGRGISMRDLRTTSRTVGKVIRINHKLQALCGAGHFAGARRRGAARGSRMPMSYPTTVVQH